MSKTKHFWMIPKESMSLEEALINANFLLGEFRQEENYPYREIHAIGPPIGPPNNPGVLGKIFYKSIESLKSQSINLFSSNIKTPEGSYLRDFLDAAKEKYRII